MNRFSPSREFWKNWHVVTIILLIQATRISEEHLLSIAFSLQNQVGCDAFREHHQLKLVQND